MTMRAAFPQRLQARLGVAMIDYGYLVIHDLGWRLLQTAIPINQQPNGSCKCLGRVSHGSNIWTPCRLSFASLDMKVSFLVPFLQVSN